MLLTVTYLNKPQNEARYMPLPSFITVVVVYKQLRHLSFSPRVSSIECSVGLSQLCKKSLLPTMRSTLAFQTTLWLILVAARLASCESSSQQCPASRPYGLSFSVVSRRNLTGHWKSELKMQNNCGSDVSGNKEDGPWEVDLVQTSEMTKSGEIFTVTAILEGPPAKPGPGYELVPDLGYYKLHTSLVTWEEARNTCSQEGAHLAIPRSQKEVNVLLGLLSRHPKIQDGELNKYAFTGIHDQYSEGHFVDIFGNPADMTVLKWFPGQPNDGGKALQNCIGLMREGKINDIYCHSKLPFLCEQKIQVY